MEKISYDDFTKLDLRVGEIVSASDVPKADRLIRMEVNIGEETPRVLIAGMKQYYDPEELVGRKIVVLVNLEPRKIRGELSNGMLLAASTPTFETVKLIVPDGDLPPGSKIS